MGKRRFLLRFARSFWFGFSLVLVSVSLPSDAKENLGLRVLTMNITCDFCVKGVEKGTFNDRLFAVADTINRHDPDLVSLQEIRSRGQVEKLQSFLREKYIAVFVEGFFLSYADPTLFVRESRFEILSREGFWLGPNSPGFGLGWKTSFPRRVEYVHLKDRSSGHELIFAGAHFDNNPRNREPSADLVAKKFSASTVPVIFAADTNLRPDRGGYITLSKNFRDTFHEVNEHPYVMNGATIPSDGCNLEKAPTFPECRVDHVLLSKNAPWTTKRWQVDTFKYPAVQGFISDHRAVVVDLAL